MANRFVRFFKGILLRGESADPSDQEDGSLWYNSSDERFKGYSEGDVREVVTTDQAQTLENKTLTSPVVSSPVLTTPQINDTSSDHQYIFGVSELAADRTVTLPLLGASDEFVFKNHAATLTNKTIDGDDNTVQDLALTSLKTNLTDADKFLVRDSSGIVISSSKAVPSGTVVGNSDSQTLTNKTIDADSNTITNIKNAEIKSGAAIAVNKLAAVTASRALASDGSGFITPSATTATELGYVSGVTSAIQTQIDGKISASSSNTLTNKTIDGDDNTIQDLALTSLKTNLTDASKFLVRDASGIVISNTKDVPTGTVVGTSDSQTLTNKTLTSPVIATIVNSGTLTLPTTSDTLVGRATTDTLTNKTLTSPVIATIVNSGTLTLPTSTDTLVGRATSDTLTNKTLTAPVIATIVNSGTLTLPTSTDTLVGRATTDTLTNKTLTAPAINGANLNFGTATNTNRLLLPADTTSNLDALTDTAGLLAYDSSLNKVVYNDATGWIAVGSGSGSGGINYFSSNPDFEINTNGYSVYDDGASAVPVDGTGGSPSSSISRSTTTPLRGTADLNWVHTSADNQGEGISFDFTINNADLGKILYGSFDYEVASGTYATGDATVYIFQDPSGTPLLIQPVGYQIQNIGGKGRHIFAFQTSSSVTSYRFCLHIATSTATAWTLAIDNMQLGPSSIQYGAPVTDWVSYTPTISWVSNATASGRWRRVGDNMEVDANVVCSGAPTSTQLTVSLPAGYSIDTSKLAAGADANLNVLGLSGMIDLSTALYTGVVNYLNTTSVYPYLTRVDGTYATNNNITQAAPFTFGSGDEVYLRFSVPILGWGSSVQMSDSADTRVVAMRAHSASASLTSGAASTTLVFPSVTFDTHGGYNASTGEYTIKVPGKYRVKAQIMSGSITPSTTTGTLDLYIHKNGSNVSETLLRSLVASIAQFPCLKIEDTFDLVAGDVIKMVWDQNWGATMTLQGSSSTNYFTVERLCGPSVIAASESIYARYTTNAGQVLSNSTTTIIDFGTRVTDSHGIVTTGASFKVTAPTAGFYVLSGRVQLTNDSDWSSGDNAFIYLYKNGSAIEQSETKIWATVSVAPGLTFPFTYGIYLLAGEYADIRIQQVSGGSVAVETGTPLCNDISVFKLPGA